jgi:3-(3-hydroxy-phenyl)propionate hydroxylase
MEARRSWSAETRPDALLDSYADEREFAADENIRCSTAATDFITPKSEISRYVRDAVLGLAASIRLRGRLVNSGRLSIAATLRGSPLNTPDVDAFAGACVPARRRRRAAGRAAGRPGCCANSARLHAAVVRRGAGLGRSTHGEPS